MTSSETSVTMADQLIAAAATLRGVANGLRAAQALFVAAQLGVADHLAAGPLSGVQLARATKSDATALTRVMRALCGLGVFSESASGAFSLNSVARLLRSDVPGSYRAGALFLAGPVRWQCWSQLLEAVETGANASERILGMPLFEYYAAHPEESRIHDEAMRAFSASHAAAILETVDFRQGEIVVDIGGGSGELLAAILARHPSLRGVLFDLPHVVEHAGRVLAEHMVLDRCSVEGGSFFETAPGGGDTYLLKQVIHDWDDERALAILRRCRERMPRSARLLMIERKLPEPSQSDATVEPFFADLEMLVMTSGGRERTETEFTMLCENAGFAFLRSVPTGSPLYVFEAEPA